MTNTSKTTLTVSDVARSLCLNVRWARRVLRQSPFWSCPTRSFAPNSYDHLRCSQLLCNAVVNRAKSPRVPFALLCSNPNA